MSSLLERERKRLTCVPLGLGKKQPFETEFPLSRTRGGLPKSVDAERDETGPAQDVRLVETQSNESLLAHNPLDDDEAVIKFFSMLKAPCLLAPCTHSRCFTHSLHTRKHREKSLTNITCSDTDRGRGDRPEQAHQ